MVCPFVIPQESGREERPGQDVSGPQQQDDRRERLLDSEDGADVVFLVGPGCWRFPAHMAILSDNSPYFRTLFTYPMSGPVVVPDVDGRAFDLLLKYMYNKRVDIKSTDTALSTLYVAHKYLCSGLMAECVGYLAEHMDKTNCLDIYQHVRLHCGPFRLPSAPCEGETPQDVDESFSHSVNMCAELMQNCNRFVDSNAEVVLSGECVEDLPRDCLKEILERDTLNVSSESVIYSAVERWSSSQCKRLRMELNHQSRRTVVSDDLLFTIRFLVMNEKEFYSGPATGKLLAESECLALLGHILKQPDILSVPTLTEEVLYNISRKRKALPLIKSNDKSKKKAKKQKKEKCNNSCALEYLARGLAFLFD